MKKVALLILSAAVALLFFACKSGNGNSPDNPLSEKKDIVHSFTFTSSVPVSIHFTASSGLGHISFDGVNEKSMTLTKEITHQATKKYTISATDYALTSYVHILSLDDQEIEVSYTWELLLDGKLVKNEKGILGKGKLLTTKVYSTTIADPLN